MIILATEKKSVPDLFDDFGAKEIRERQGNEDREKGGEPADSLQGKKFLKDNVSITRGPSSDPSIRPDEDPSVQTRPLFPGKLF